MQNLVHARTHFNAPDEHAVAASNALRQTFLALGVELHHRGQRPVAEFIAELADLPLVIAAEIQARLSAYTRIDAATYAALGGDVFTRYMIAIPGGK